MLIQDLARTAAVQPPAPLRVMVISGDGSDRPVFRVVYHDRPPAG